ncbi:class I SAM-dependent methyltransferase [Kurthia sibirica]|uniref:SAM-dependent methyltransferase n=1 Tax=Kurthia sibirica TaxID=202750 RepID=A0A2U3AMD0_9BACL|nr:class I SAM-dependent methyltransferase [Kurthia sibirica]PWI25674.1 SAM-dependent methyltransferase [Kurthia sibirica]GEK33679.1 methyltransferase [Kurthia sibirica]
MNTWQEHFDTETYIYGTAPNEFIAQHYDLFKGSKKIGAFAEGEGRNAVFLSSRGFMLTSFDYAQNGLNKTKKLASQNNVHVATRLTDLLTDSTPVEEFDGAIMVYGHFHKKDQFHVFNKIMAAVKKGSRVMMEMYSEEQLAYKTGGPQTMDMLYNAQQVLQWCNNYQVEHFYTGEALRQEGERHSGLAHIIQLIIIK